MIRQRSLLTVALAGVVAPAIVLGHERASAEEPAPPSSIPPTALRPVGTDPAAIPLAPIVDPGVLDPSPSPVARPTSAVPVARPRVVAVPTPRPRVVAVPMRPRVVAVPTQRPPKAVTKSTSTGTHVPSVADAKAYALSRIGSTQYRCLDRLWTRESNWNPYASNRSSGAYGIPQAVPGNKMAIAAADWRTNPVTQVKWGLGYIANQYGSACNAWAYSQNHGWY